MDYKVGSENAIAEAMRLQDHDSRIEMSNVKIQMSNGGCAARDR
jgi:hypothetical protein